MSKKKREHSPELKAQVGLEALKGIEPVRSGSGGIIAPFNSLTPAPMATAVASTPSSSHSSPAQTPAHWPPASGATPDHPGARTSR